MVATASDYFPSDSDSDSHVCRPVHALSWLPFETISEDEGSGLGFVGRWQLFVDTAADSDGMIRRMGSD